MIDTEGGIVRDDRGRVPERGASEGRRQPPRAPKSAIPIGLIALSAGVVGFVAWRVIRNSRVGGPLISDAPQRALRRAGNVVGRTVTIARPRSELYAFWRDFSRLPTFMENVRRVDVIDGRRSRWVIAGPAGLDISFGATITEDRPNEHIAWRSDERARVRNRGRIVFRDAPAGRGTEVEATIEYDPPAGEAGRLVARLLQREPAIQARRDLKRFKQLMEAGEIATTEPGSAAPRA